MGRCGTCGKARAKLNVQIEEEKRKRALRELKQTTISEPAPEQPKRLNRSERIEARRKRIEARSARVAKRNAMIIARQTKNGK